jgi:hypothetical protein
MGVMMPQRRRGKKQAKTVQPRRRPREGSLVLGQRNVLMLVAGIIVILIGYLLLGRGSITTAPLLLVVGYCVIIPLSIILWSRRPDDGQQSKTGE